MPAINKAPLPFLALALLALLAALWAGLLRLGWSLPPLSESLAFMHGPLMVSGFLGTLITLERVVALRHRWMYVVPLLTGLGWLVSLMAASSPLGPLLLTLGSFGGVLILIVIFRRDSGLHSLIMLLGMVAWAVGNLLWAGTMILGMFAFAAGDTPGPTGLAIFQVVYFWQGFLVLTILGERLELNRVLRLGRWQVWLFGLFSLLLLAGMLVFLSFPSLGSLLSAAALIGFGLWSIPNDIAWRNLNHKLPLTRYIAWCLAAGFIWLAISGLLSLIYGPQFAGPFYDAILHSVFVGFVISMIFGHAPIIFPAVLGRPINFHPSFYAQLALLHLSLILRILSDLTAWVDGRKWGGLLNEVAILLFLGTTIYMLRRSLSAR